MCNEQKTAWIILWKVLCLHSSITLPVKSYIFLTFIETFYITNSLNNSSWVIMGIVAATAWKQLAFTTYHTHFTQELSDIHISELYVSRYLLCCSLSCRWYIRRHLGFNKHFSVHFTPIILNKCSLGGHHYAKLPLYSPSFQEPQYRCKTPPQPADLPPTWPLLFYNPH